MSGRFSAGDYTVLVVDSDRRACADLTALLERAGFHARAFHSGETLLDEIAAFRGKVCVILEAELPDMTGLDLISRLREARVDAPMMILTRLGDVATAVRAMRGKVSDYLMKPYVERDLINRLRAALTKERAAAG